MSLLDNQEAQVKVRGVWTRISIEDALRLDSAEIKRCIACHGRMRAHKRAVTGQRAHFEHLSGHTGCSRMGPYFSGVASLHPDPET